MTTDHSKEHSKILNFELLEIENGQGLYVFNESVSLATHPLFKSLDKLNGSMYEIEKNSIKLYMTCPYKLE